MLVSLNWLKELVQLHGTPAEIAERITLAGLEVEAVEQVGSLLDGVVVGHVLTCDRHPDADRLSVCTVDIGAEAPVRIVCGAPNVAAGQRVPVATVGTELPVKLPDGSPLVIRKSKIRGQVSEGMICALDELGLGSDHSGIWVLDTTAAPGTALAEVTSLDVDHVLEVAITPNRPDATCHLGIARDLAAVANVPLRKPEPAIGDLPPADPADIRIRIEDADACPRYVGVVIRNVQAVPSPEPVRRRLEAIGLRPINALVDATNLVMREMGQPLHAFDLDRIATREIVVRSYGHETRFTTLDGHERTVPAGGLYICDGETPVALAGVMGGANSEIHNGTTQVLLESAYFEPRGIRKTAKAVGLQTDASYRFERGIDPTMARTAALRCASLIREWIPGAEVVSICDVEAKPFEAKHIRLRTSFVNRVLGTQLKTAQVVSILKSLEFGVGKPQADEVDITVPPFRPDVSREIDLVEEVARIYNYNEIPMPGTISFSRPTPLPFREIGLRRIREAAVRLGFREMYGNSLVPEEQAAPFAAEHERIRALNPISRDTTTLRPDLAPGFLKAAAFNFNREAEQVRLFEIGNIFRYNENGRWHPGVLEETHLVLGLGGQWTSAHWSVDDRPIRPTDLAGLVAGFLTHLGLESADRDVQGDQIIYSMGPAELGRLRTPDAAMRKTFDLDKPVAYAEFSVDRLLAAMEQRQHRAMTPVPKFPSVSYDIAVVVPAGVSAGELEATIRAKAGATLRGLTVFDVYEGKGIPEGHKSLAWRLTLREEAKTLTSKDVEAIISRVVSALENRHQARLRV